MKRIYKVRTATHVVCRLLLEPGFGLALEVPESRAIGALSNHADESCFKLLLLNVGFSEG